MARLGAAFTILAAVAVVGSAMGLGRRQMRVCFTGPRQIPSIGIPSVDRILRRANLRERARYELRSIAYEAYPWWVARNPDRECPERLSDLGPYVGDDTIDPWGTPYQFLCGRQHGVRGLRTRSAGPDRTFDTADDLASDEPRRAPTETR